MLEKNENKILNLIKFAPTIIVIIIMVILSYLFFLDKEVQFQKSVNDLKKNFVEQSKERIKNEIESINQYIIYEKRNSETALKEELKNRVNEAHRIASHIYEKYKNINTKEEIIVKIKDALRNFNFDNGMGYFYIYNLKGVNVLHPIKPHLEGKNMMDFKDKRGNYISRDVIKALSSSNEVYYELYWNKPLALDNVYRKITFNKLFKELDFFIGTGEYVDDFEEKIKARVLSYIGKIKYGNNAYVFVIDYFGNYLSHLNKNYIGYNRINEVDEDGVFITQEIIKQAKKGYGFVSYKSTIKPESLKSSKKITYVVGLEDWDWAIATGFYFDELENNLNKIEKEAKQKNREDLINIISLGVLLTLFFIAISMYTSKIIRFRFLKHKRDLIREIEKNKKKDLILAQQSKMASMGEMIQNIAHQWRQPLNVILSQSSSLKFKNELNLVKETDIDETMDNIGDTIKYLSNTIDDFRNFFSPNKEIKLFDIQQTFNKVIKLLSNQLNNKNIEIVQNIDTSKIYGLENELIQVIINMINNSRDEFLKKDKKDRKLIFLESKELQDKVVIKIKDNAGGIDENIISKVFDSYFTTKSDSNGTGIGLYMSKQIIEEHLKGVINVYNEEFIYDGIKYKGACFEIVLIKNCNDKKEEK